MIVISDTSPINYLLQIDLIDLLPRLYTRVLIPAEVHAELIAEGAPEIVSTWASHLPTWCTLVSDSMPHIALIEYLDPGERAAIEMAMHLRVNRILLDDLKARKAAASFVLIVTGTLGVIQAAANLGAVDLHDAIDRLMATNFNASKKVIDRILQRESQ